MPAKEVSQLIDCHCCRPNLEKNIYWFYGKLKNYLKPLQHFLEKMRRYLKFYIRFIIFVIITPFDFCSQNNYCTEVLFTICKRCQGKSSFLWKYFTQPFLKEFLLSSFPWVQRVSGQRHIKIKKPEVYFIIKNTFDRNWM